MLRIIEKKHGQDYKRLVKECKRENSLYEDNVFDDDVALMLSFEGLIRNRQEIIWLRPHEICQKRYEDGYDEEKNTPRMYVEGVNRFDVNQGTIGDCYFMAALSQLADDKWAFDRIVPPGQTFDKAKGYVGVFRYRFYRLGKWEEIVIDDRLPVRKSNLELFFVRSDSKYEFWAPLVEKAYAKFRGSYLKIHGGGLVSDAAVHLTGGIPFKHKISEDMIFPFEHETSSVDELPLKLIKYHEDHAMTFAGIGHGKGKHSTVHLLDIGLPPNHEYSVTGILKFEDTYLIRIRNPHGQRSKEWEGRWSDESPEWSAFINLGKNTYRQPVKLDGEFFMSYRYFMKYFTDYQVVIMKPSKSRFDFYQWTGSCIGTFDPINKDRFNKGDPMIKFSIYNPDRKDYEKKKCSVIVSLEKNDQSYEDEHYAILKWKRTGDSLLWQRIEFENYTLSRSFHTGNYIELEKGDYIIMPWTYQRNDLDENPECDKKLELYRAGKKREFHLRLFIEINWGSTEFWRKK